TRRSAGDSLRHPAGFAARTTNTLSGSCARCRRTVYGSVTGGATLTTTESLRRTSGHAIPAGTDSWRIRMPILASLGATFVTGSVTSQVPWPK
ncbi:MAG TPA: hypothetical protein VFK04_14445, partial [Gemmatimonadaceae bacterium]|nr:hypothetical protein [Gemmatimonadaceae bacterium]